MRTTQQVLEHQAEQNRLANVSGICLRITLLFGSAALALTLVLIPSHREQSWFNPHYDPGVEFIATGSITPRLPVAASEIVARNYRESYGCVISPNGSKSGTC